MALQQRSIRYILVPDESTLFFKTIGPKTGFTISAQLLSAGTLLESWVHNQLIAAEQQHILHSSKNYELIVDVAFTGNTNVNVDVNVRIVKADNSQHSKTKTLSFSGKSPTSQSGTAQIITRKSKGKKS